MSKFPPLCLLAFALLFSNHSSANNSETIIKGFTKYQADRIENLILNEYLENLPENALFSAFFPNTSKGITDTISAVSAKRILPLLSKLSEKDIGELKSMLECIKSDPYDANIIASLASYKKHLKSTNPADFTIAACNPTNVDTSLKKTKFFEDKEKFKSRIDDIISQASSVAQLTNTQPLKIDQSTTNPKLRAIELLNKPSGTFGFETLAKTAMTQAKKKEIGEKNKAVSELEGIIEAVTEINAKSYEQAIETIQSMDSGGSSTSVYIYQFFNVLESFGFKQTNHSSYRKFKSASLFIASLQEATDADEVASLINDFVDEELVYNNKRSESAMISIRSIKNGNEASFKTFTYCFTCRETLFIGSYYGIATSNGDSDLRAYGPVALEYKFLSLNGSPVTLGVAPIDLGAYITNELQGDDYEADLEDITSTSFFVSYSLRNNPISIMAGWQDEVRVSPTEEDEMFFLALTFDLPLFTLW